MLKIILLSLILVCGLSNALAQTPPNKPNLISAGIVNGKATALPKPNYPAAAQAAKATGEVKIQVTIDELGNVISASATSGHPLLRQTSEQAAQQAKFSPTLLSGQPVKVTGVIIYNFVGELSNEEKVQILGLGMILSLLKNSASNLETLEKILESNDVAKESIDFFPEYSTQLAPLIKFRAVPKNERIELIERTVSLMSDKLKSEEKWQFELGQNFGELLSPMFLAVKGENDFDFGRLDEASLKTTLTKIKPSLAAAPKSFPIDVLEKFKKVADFDQKPALTEPENIHDLFLTVTDLFETISPDSTK